MFKKASLFLLLSISGLSLAMDLEDCSVVTESPTNVSASPRSLASKWENSKDKRPRSLADRLRSKDLSREIRELELRIEADPDNRFTVGSLKYLIVRLRDERKRRHGILVTDESIDRVQSFLDISR